MSKRTRHKDNSKRQQPIQQQRAQARQPGANKAGGGSAEPKNASNDAQRRGKGGSSGE